MAASSYEPVLHGCGQRAINPIVPVIVVPDGSWRSRLGAWCARCPTSAAAALARRGHCPVL